MPKTKFSLITEGQAHLYVHNADVVSKKMAVFYNPVMKTNRDICISLLNEFEDLRILDALAASGIRSVRILTETKHTRVQSNDLNPTAIKLIKKNAKYNKVHLETSCEDVNDHLYHSKGYDYIDLDVFGSPNQFLDISIKRISRDGILALTATDTAPLCGTYPRACRRKYWAEPLRNELKHEVGLRILIRKIQLIGAQYDKALIPIYSHSSDHYFRAYLQNHHGKSACDTLLKEHDTVWHCATCGNFAIGDQTTCPTCAHTTIIAGPLYTGPLWDRALATTMAKKAKENTTKKVLQTIAAECNISIFGAYDMHALCKRQKLRVPQTSLMIEKLEQLGYLASNTHFNPHSIKTNAPFEVFIQLLREESSK